MNEDVMLCQYNVLSEQQPYSQTTCLGFNLHSYLFLHSKRQRKKAPSLETEF